MYGRLRAKLTIVTCISPGLLGTVLDIVANKKKKKIKPMACPFLFGNAVNPDYIRSEDPDPEKPQ